jgi:diacylglycerol kinase (ATP)
MSGAVRFVANPGGGRGRVCAHLDELRSLAVGAGLPFALSRDAADLTTLARQATDDGCERLVVAGGDGTVHYAVQGLAGSGCALAVVPLGSGNDFATALGVPRDPASAVRLALTGTVRSVDLVRFGGHRYVCVGGIGFDSAANEVANRVRRLRGRAIYLYSVLHTLATFRAPRLAIEHEQGCFEGEALLVAIANAPSYGGGMRIAPAADLSDGLLDLVIVRKVPLPTFLRVFPRVYKGTHVDHPAVYQARSRWARVRADRDLPVYGDGERLGTTGEPELGRDALFEIIPAGLKVVTA